MNKLTDPELAGQLALRAWVDRQAAATNKTYSETRDEWLLLARLLDIGRLAGRARESLAVLTLRSKGYLDPGSLYSSITPAGAEFLAQHPEVVATIHGALDRLASQVPWQDLARWQRWYSVALTWFETEQAANRPVAGAGLFTPQTVPAAEVDHYRAIAACLERLRASLPPAAPEKGGASAL